MGGGADPTGFSPQGVLTGGGGGATVSSCDCVRSEKQVVRGRTPDTVSEAVGPGGWSPWVLFVSAESPRSSPGLVKPCCRHRATSAGPNMVNPGEAWPSYHQWK